MTNNNEENEMDDHRFEEIAKAYGHVEATLGQEGYQSLVHASLSQSDLNKAKAGLIRILGLSVFLMSIPVLVWLWKWAL